MELEFQRKANAIYHKPNANALTRKFPTSIKKDDITNVSLRLFSRQYAIKTDLKDIVLGYEPDYTGSR